MKRFASLGILAALLLLAPGRLLAQGCVDFETSMRLVGGEGSYDHVRGVALYSNYAYVTDWQAMTTNSALLVCDLDTPAARFFRGTAAPPGTPMGLTTFDVDKLAVATDDGLWFAEHPDPDADPPMPLGTYTTAGGAQHVTVVDTLAFVAVSAEDLDTRKLVLLR